MTREFHPMLLSLIILEHCSLPHEQGMMGMDMGSLAGDWKISA
jgi:hypothetical protein